MRVAQRPVPTVLTSAVNLIESAPEAAASHAQATIDALVDWLNLQRRYRRALPRPPSEDNRTIDEDLVDELRALGYLD